MRAAQSVIATIREHPVRFAYLGLTLTALFWAGNTVVARGTVGTLPPLALSFWRWVGALLIVLPFALPALRREWPLIRADWPSMLAIAGLSTGMFNTLLYVAVQTTSAVNVALINATIPAMVALLARVMLGSRIRGVQAAGILASFAGIATIVTRGQPLSLTGIGLRPGDLIMLAAVACWALFSVLMRRQAVPLSPVAFLSVQIAFGLPLILPFYLLELVLVGGFTPDPEAGLAVLYAALFPGLLAYAFWNNGVRTVGPTHAAQFMNLVPFFAAALGLVFLGESLGAFHMAGGALIVAGLWLATRPTAM